MPDQNEFTALEERRAAEERINRDQQRAIQGLNATLDTTGAALGRAQAERDRLQAERDRLRETLAQLVKKLDGAGFQDWVSPEIRAATKEPADAT